MFYHLIIPRFFPFFSQSDYTKYSKYITISRYTCFEKQGDISGICCVVAGSVIFRLAIDIFYFILLLFCALWDFLLLYGWLVHSGAEIWPYRLVRWFDFFGEIYF